MLQHHQLGPEEERPRGRLPSVRTGDPPPAVGFGNMTMERVTEQQLDLPACELDLVAKNGPPKFVTCN